MEHLRMPNIHIMIYEKPNRQGERASFVLFIENNGKVNQTFFSLLDCDFNLIPSSIALVPDSEDFEFFLREEFEQSLLILREASFLKTIFSQYGFSIDGWSLVKHFFFKSDWKKDCINCGELDVLDKYIKMALEQWSRNYASRKISTTFPHYRMPAPN